MQLSFGRAQLTGLAVLALVGATVSVGACSSSQDEKSSEKSSQTSAAGGQGEVRGLVSSVSGSAVEVTEASGTATVEVSPSTKVVEDIGAQLTDVVAGNCLRVAFGPEGAQAPGGDVVAMAVRLTQVAPGGKCALPKTEAIGMPNGRLDGTVAAVEGNTITVSYTDAEGTPAEAHVGVTDKTRYRKDVATTAQAIAPNKCIIAQGTKGDDGKLRAKTVNVSPEKGNCAQPTKK